MDDSDVGIFDSPTPYPPGESQLLTQALVEGAGALPEEVPINDTYAVNLADVDYMYQYRQANPTRQREVSSTPPTPSTPSTPRCAPPYFVAHFDSILLLASGPAVHFEERQC